MVEGETGGQTELERFLRLLAIFRESWWLILLPTIAAGAAAYGYASSRPVAFRSEAMLKLTRSDVTLFKSDRVYGAQVEKVEASSPEALPIGLSLSALDSADTFSVVVTSATPEGAPASLQGMIEAMQIESRPAGATKAMLETKLKVIDTGAEQLNRSLDQTNKLVEQMPADSPDARLAAIVGNASRAFVIASTTQNELTRADVADQLNGTFRAENVLVPPAATATPIERGKAPMVAVAIVVTLAAMLGLAVLRRTLRELRARRPAGVAHS